MKAKLLLFLTGISIIGTSFAEYTQAKWTTVMNGIDTTEKRDAVRAAVAGKPPVRIVIANSEGREYYGGGTAHDEFEQAYMQDYADYLGLNVEIYRTEPARNIFGTYDQTNMVYVYEDALARGDIIVDFHSYWDRDPSTTKPGGPNDPSRLQIAEFIRQNPNRLFMLPYGEISPTPSTDTSLQGMAEHADGTGFKNLILTIPLAKGKIEKGETSLCPVKRRYSEDKAGNVLTNDIATATFISPSGYSNSNGDTCQSIACATVMAAYLYAYSDRTLTASEIKMAMQKGCRIPDVNDEAGFTEEVRAGVTNNIAAYNKTDSRGRKKLLYSGVLSLQGSLEYLQGGHAHDWTDWVTRTEPGCTSNGERIRSCRECLIEQTETIPALGHNYQGGITRRATTTEEGLISYICQNCHDTYTRTIPTEDAIPQEYTPLLYVSATDGGNQYIDTGIKAGANLRAEMELSVNTINTNQNTFALASYASDAEAYIIGVTKEGKWSWSLGSGSRPIGSNVSTNTIYKIISTIGTDAKTMTFSANGTTGPAYTATSIGTTKFSLHLLGRNEEVVKGGDASKPGRYLNAKIYAAKIYIGSELKRNYIPCQNAAGVAGLYDTISSAFHPSAGAPFLASPNILPSEPTIGGKTIAPEEVFLYANSQTPIVYPTTPTLSTSQRTITYGGKTITIPTWYNATLSGNTINLQFTGKGATPVISSFEITKDGKVSFQNSNAKSTLWYSIGSKSNFSSSWSWSSFTQGTATFSLPTSSPSGFYTIQIQDHK